jgi:hypothetical protein
MRATAGETRARRIEAPRARVGHAVPRRRAPPRGASRRMADSPSKTGRPDACDRRGYARAARGRPPVRVRARAPRALAARRRRGTACLGARSGVPQGDPAAVLVVTLVSEKKKCALFFVAGSSVARLGASASGRSRYDCVTCAS